MASKSSDMMRFNVGGKTFETTATTLAVAGPNSFFGPLLNGNWTLQPNHQDVIFIDRDPECFSVILNLLRTGELHVPSNVPKDLLLKEAQFYGVLDLVRAATWGPFDGDRLSLSKSVMIPRNQKASLIRASPTGGCCVASGCSIIRVYDWMLREQSPIILDCENASDIAWIDSSNIIVASGKKMKLFDLSQTHQMFQYTQDVYTNYKFTALCLDNDGRIYSGFNGKGIGVWDRERSDPIDFFYDSNLADEVDKLHWSPGTKSLLVGTLSPDSMNCCLRLLDFRQKKIVWSWSQPDSDKDRIEIHDMVMKESRKTIFLVDKYENLGFIDLRFNKQEVPKWRRWRRIPGAVKLEGKVKLVEHEDQLICSNGDQITVYSTGGCGVFATSNLRTSNTIRFINDLSIANGRLFSLGETCFDVWETIPVSPIL